MSDARQPWLIAAAALSGAAALLHLATIAGGPGWYRFLGAGERMARLAEAGSPRPALITLLIASVLAIWSAYALAGAGLIPRLPLLRTALVTITAVYLLRGLVLAPALAMNGGRASPFLWWSSLIVLAFGITYAVGTFRAWPTLAAGAR
ncbi:MAG TPA: hypothetical protein VF718_00600 [Allosphingosinicella sp.]|jgi:hypothetical protein